MSLLARGVAVAVVVLATVTGGAIATAVTDLDAEPESDPPTPSPERTTVTVFDEDAARIATVDVRIADTRYERYRGLSRTESLADGEGMLFVHERERTYPYVMREMAFPIDIVFVAANGTVTTVHHAELPPPGVSGNDLTEYRGYGRYVLEVPYGYTNRTGIEEGDRIEIDGY